MEKNTITYDYIEVDNNGIVQVDENDCAKIKTLKIETETFSYAQGAAWERQVPDMKTKHCIVVSWPDLETKECYKANEFVEVWDSIARYGTFSYELFKNDSEAYVFLRKALNEKINFLREQL